jgi:uncharacterized protein with HEPN domain
VQPRDWRLRIRDILEAVGHIVRYIRGMDFEAFTSDQITIDAVAYNLTIIGEAATHIPSEVQSRYSHISWADMRSNRNFIVHEYFGVNPQTVWDTITQDLPPLVPPR